MGLRFDGREVGRAGSLCVREQIRGWRTRCLPGEAHLALAQGQRGVTALGRAALTAQVLAFDLPEVLPVVKAGMTRVRNSSEITWLIGKKYEKCYFLRSVYNNGIGQIGGSFDLFDLGWTNHLPHFI